MNADVRASAAKNLTYGNRTVIPTMMDWSGLVKAVSIHGDHTQVFATAMGVEDAKRQYGDFGYPIEVVTTVTTQGPAFRDWQSFLQNWYGISTVGNWKPNDRTALILLDINANSPSKIVAHAKELITKASQVGAKVYLSLEPNEVLPNTLRGQREITGSSNSYLNQLANPLLESSLYNFSPEAIHVFGTSLRTVTTAIGALDFLARFSAQPISQLSGQVTVDQFNPQNDWGKVAKLTEVLDTFGFAWTKANLGNLSPITNKVLVTPIP